MASGAATDDDSPVSSPTLSPKNRLKFLCSFGGKILPRPSDGHLKYVGGDTRVLVVPRSVSFSDLKKKIQGMFHRCNAIKYQLMSEDLDTLVTVSSNEDLAHMLDEYDRIDALHPRSPSSSSSPRFRLFLFPSRFSSSSPTAAAAYDHAAATLDQRYVDAINSVVPGSPRRAAIFTISAASSTATSPTSTIDGPGALLGLRTNAQSSGGGGMHRVQSTPNLGRGMERVNSTPNLGGGGGDNRLVSQMSNGATSPQHHHNHHQHQHYHQQHQYYLQQQHHNHWQQTPGLSSYRVQAAGGSGPWRAGVAPRHEAWGCRVPQPAARGVLHPGVGAGNIGVRIPEESSSARPSRSSSPFRAPPRKPVIWE
ncbi:hypothetical protein Cni_G12326 [Canna indica]|uniref:PB1 domain-containing protein n=1 Tax=Canna indica TaxID=4628 RepID=A0AAQ3Q8X4_9LILI|nr:hypothetical protein Cni_G12326 [Canna indica]